MAQLKKETTIDNQSLLDYFYPIGTIYQTSDASFNPTTHFGGNWEKIENRFLLGDSSSKTVGSTGGEETHKLTIAEMPSHSHGYYSPIVQGVTGNNSSNSYGNYNKQYIIDTNPKGGGIAQQYASLLCGCHLEKNFLKSYILEFLSIFMKYLKKGEELYYGTNYRQQYCRR